jgi:uncharacterized membrane protein YjjP (DUF1212 family)
MRVAVTMLANGAQTEDVEASIGQLADAFDVGGVQAAVSFSMISISGLFRGSARARRVTAASG